MGRHFLRAFLCEFNLIQIEFHPAVISFQKVDFIDSILFVVIEDFDVFIFQQVQINLVSVVANAHDKSPFQVEGLDLLMHG